MYKKLFTVNEVSKAVGIPKKNNWKHLKAYKVAYTKSNTIDVALLYASDAITLNLDKLDDITRNKLDSLSPYQTVELLTYVANNLNRISDGIQLINNWLTENGI